MDQTVDLEITHNRITRIVEILPGLLAWSFLLAPIVFSLVQPVVVAYLIIAYALLWLVKAIGLSIRLVRGYRRLHVANVADWQARLTDLMDPEQAIARLNQQIKAGNTKPLQQLDLRYYRSKLQEVATNESAILDHKQVYHAVIVAVYNESLEIVEPTIKNLLNSEFPLQRLWLFIAYEERGGAQTAKNVEYLIKTYGHKFGYAVAIKHPQDIKGEVIGKGGNITYTGKRVTTYVKKRGLDPEHVVVTTLDADNRPSPKYFPYLTFTYCSTPERVHKSYQPIPMYYNNIWDVPAPMRVIATGNTFWILMETLRPHRLRNFSAHAQSLKTLIDTNYWSVKTVVEDGHQFWRTYFRYNGKHQVVPLYMPVYQDAVLARGYLRTFKAQFIQLRRWAWGASDIAYVFYQSVQRKQINWMDKTIHFLRLFEGHFSWATAPLVLAFAAWLPLLLNPSFNDQVLAHQLPVIASRIQTLAMIGVFITILISMISLPPRPDYYKRRRSFLMILQWVLLPVTAIVFSAFAALTAQTRLMFGRYLEEFDVTEKATKR